MRGTLVAKGLKLLHVPRKLKKYVRERTWPITNICLTVIYFVVLLDFKTPYSEHLSIIASNSGFPSISILYCSGVTPFLTHGNTVVLNSLNLFILLISNTCSKLVCNVSDFKKFFTNPSFTSFSKAGKTSGSVTFVWPKFDDNFFVFLLSIFSLF